MINFLSKNPLALILLLLLTAGAMYGCTQLKFYHDLKDFFPEEDTDLDFYEEHRSRFESDDNFIYIALENEPSIFDSVFLAKVAAFTDSCKNVPHIESVTSLTEAKDVVFTPLGPMAFPLLHYDDPLSYHQDSIKMMQNENLVNRYFSEDGTVAAVLLKHKEETSESENFIISDRLAALLKEFGFEGAPMAGRVNSTTEIIRQIEREVQSYALLSALFVLVVLILLLQRFWGVTIAFLSVVNGLILFMGLIGIMGIELNLMSTLFPILMLVVGMSDVIHILSKYIDELRKGLSQDAAMKVAVKEIGLATLLTSITTAIGFVTLYTSNIKAITSFGLLAALGVFIAYISVIIVAISVLSRFKQDQLANIKKQNDIWDRLMLASYRLVKNNKALMASIGLVVMIVSLIGLTKISTNTYILGDLPTDSQLRKDFIYFEDKLSGVRPFEMAITAQDPHRINEIAVLEEIEKVANYITSKEEIKTLMGPHILYKSVRKAYHASKMEEYLLPQNEKELKKYDRQLKDKRVDIIMTPDRKYARLNGNIRDLGSDVIRAFNTDVNEWIAANTNPDLVEFRMTGSGLLVDKNHEFLRKNLFTGLAMAFLIVSILMALLFRNWKMVLISLVPNVFPLIVTGAVMGYTSVTLMASSSIIFTIAFGIAVDDTIHFLSKFKLQLNKGKTIDEAIKNTFLETGKALCITTLILFFGFLILTLSSFQMTFYVGLLISITLFTALIADLFLMPVFIYWFMKDE